jgi:methionine-rich copper-binding protein CopC
MKQRYLSALTAIALMAATAGSAAAQNNASSANPVASETAASAQTAVTAPKDKSVNPAGSAVSAPKDKSVNPAGSAVAAPKDKSMPDGSGAGIAPKDKAAASSDAPAPKDKTNGPGGTSTVVPKDKSFAGPDATTPKDKETATVPTDMRNLNNGTTASGQPLGGLQVVPNPVKEEHFRLNFEAAPSAGPIEATVSNMAGDVVWTETIDNDGQGRFQMEVRPQTLPDGYYFVTIVSGNNVQRKKVVVKH